MTQRETVYHNEMGRMEQEDRFCEQASHISF